MSARSNFGDVTVLRDGTVRIVGRSKDPVLEVYASVVARPPGDERVPPESELTGRFIGNVVPSSWPIEIGPSEEHPFAPGDAVLVAGVAIRADGDHDVWCDSVTLRPG